MTMTTYSGRRLDPLAITPEDICLQDIAHALSQLCRGGGHLKQFYSVAQHAINCAKEAKARGYGQRVQLSCLLHDASEAYLSDIVRPFKKHLTQYLTMEERVMELVLERFGLSDLSDEERRCWKQIDDDILDHELRALMNGEEQRPVRPMQTAPDLSVCLCADVEAEFLRMAADLWQDESE